MAVSANFFAVLGADAALGRTFLPEEERKGRAGVLVLSEGFWRRRFAADPKSSDGTIDIDGASVQIVGIMARGFTFAGAEADYWTPMVYDEALFRSMRRPHWFRAVAPAGAWCHAGSGAGGHDADRCAIWSVSIPTPIPRWALASVPFTNGSSATNAVRFSSSMGAVAPRAAHRLREYRQPASGEGDDAAP